MSDQQSGGTAGTDPDNKPKKKKEGWLGTVVTGVLCLGFLWFWFKPAKKTWESQSTAQYVARAMAEPPTADPTEKLMLDFDLMETSLLQARQGMAPEGVETAVRIAHPTVQARAVRQLAQAHLNSDSKRMGDALSMCDRIADPAARIRMREELLLQIAAMGFRDVALPEAKTLLFRARLAHRLAETDGQDIARSVLQEIDTALPNLPPSEAAALRTEAAWTRVSLALSDGPQQAFALIKSLPPQEQEALWLDLFRVCFGLGEEAPKAAAEVVAQVTDPALKRKLELEAMLSNIPLRPEAELLAELHADLKAAPSGISHIKALIILSDAQRRAAPGPEADAAAATLHQACEEAQALADPVQRATQMAELTDDLRDALMLAETTQMLTAASEAARTVKASEERVSVLVTIMRQAYGAGEMQLAAILATEASALITAGANAAALKPESLEDLASFLIRIGDWRTGLGLVFRLPDAEKRAALLDELTTTVAEEAIGYDPTQPPSRGDALDRIRARAISDEGSAALMVQDQPAGLARARAWLALAKGQLLAPGNLPTATPDPIFNGSGIPMDSQGPAAGGPDAASDPAGESSPSDDSDPLLNGPAENASPAGPVNADPAPPVPPPAEPEPPLPAK